MTDAKLLPCPFCGQEPILQEQPAHTHTLATFMPDHLGSWTVECCDCGMIKDTREAVIAAWNRRTPSVSPSAEARELVRDLRKLSQWLETSLSGFGEYAKRCRDAATFIERTAAPGVTDEMVRNGASAVFQRFARDGGFCGIEAAQEIARDVLTAALSSPKEGGTWTQEQIDRAQAEAAKLADYFANEGKDGAG
jgi:Lar family restriction alleviation protein